jgi:hypothetical protein
VGEETGGTLVFLTIAGSFFGFMLLLALLSVSIRAYRSVRGEGWPDLRDLPVAILDVLLMLVWGVIILAAFMACAVAVLALVVASISFTFASELALPEILRKLLTIELIYGIVIGASLAVGLALVIPVLINELISERKSTSGEGRLEELREQASREPEEGRIQSPQDELLSRPFPQLEAVTEGERMD